MNRREALAKFADDIEDARILIYSKDLKARTWAPSGEITACIRELLSKVEELEGLVLEAGRLQAINREREARGFPLVYNPLLDVGR